MTPPFARQAHAGWGRVIRAPHLIARPQHRGEVAALLATDGRGRVLGAGLGRAYGDSELNPDGRLISGRALDRFISFDGETGVLRAEGGISLDAILATLVPRGWFLPTTPGTRFVTLAGAVANDVHGKNHHRVGSMGCHVRRIGLIRSDRGELELSATDEPDLFFATLGGLGLTGFIQWVELRMTPIASSFLDQEAMAFPNLDGFFDLIGDSDARFEHVAAWIDCSAGGAALGRGVLFRANWASEGGLEPHSGRQRKIPFEAPAWALNPLTIGLLNMGYGAIQPVNGPTRRLSYGAVFHPLDAIAGWNLAYGPRGFHQHQFVVPAATQRDAVAAALGAVHEFGQHSFVSVLKTLGPRGSGGLISFPEAGTTLAMDFPNRGASTLALLDRLDRIALDAGGRPYPAKDGRMSAATFQAAYPRWREVEALRDPLFESAFWRRVSR